MRVLLITYDNASYMNFFPMNIAYIAAALREAGHDVEIYSQDIHHYPEEHLTQYLDDRFFDAVGLGVTGGYYQYRKLLAISEAINASKNRPFYVIGGHGPSPEPEYFLRKTGANAVVIGEGEETIVHLLSDKQYLKDIDGIAYRDGDKVFVNPRRPLLDINAIPMPAYDLFNMECYRLRRFPGCSDTDFSMAMLSGRGCKWTCNFCYRMDEGFRPRSPESIIEEVQLLQKDYGITYIAFQDELMMSSEQRVNELCEAFLKSKLKFKWLANGRLNFATPDILKLMKEAGCNYINYGIESFDNEILKIMRKGLTTDVIERGIKTTREAGISPGLNVIFGNIGENKRTLRQSLDFLVKYSDWKEMRTIRPVTPYPGCPLYYHAIETGLLDGPEDFYENKHLNSDLLAVNFTDMTDEEFHEALLEANTTLVKKFFENKSESYIRQARNLYLNRNSNFRGFRTD